MMASRHERRMRKKEEKKKRRQRQNAKQKKKELVIRSVKWGAIFLLVLAAGWWLFSSISEREPWPYGSVHWHADLQIEVCDELRSLSHLGSQSVHHGAPTVHTHGDNTYHLEGDPRYMERARLGSFFDAIGVPFSDRGVFEYADGGSCPDGSDTFIVEVNGERIENATGYLPQDGDTIAIRFGGEA